MKYVTLLKLLVTCPEIFDDKIVEIAFEQMEASIDLLKHKYVWIDENINEQNCWYDECYFAPIGFWCHEDFGYYCDYHLEKIIKKWMLNYYTECICDGCGLILERCTCEWLH